MLPEKLSISFSIWGLFDTGEDCVYHNWDSLMKEYVERGFNCIRLDCAAGLLTDLDGNPIEELKFHPSFGKYSKHIRQMDAVPNGGVINFRKRLLELFRAADKYDVKIVLSSWLIAHTYWFFDESVTKPFLVLPFEDKIVHVAKDLKLILDMLKEQNLIHCVAFVEIFNEMDDIPCYPIINLGRASKGYAAKIRSVHEEMIEMLRNNHPDVKYAYDVSKAEIRDDLIPRNIDVLNFHNYYLWNVYLPFEKDLITESLLEPELPESLTKYLDMNITNDDVLDEMKGAYLSSCFSFVPRIRIYADIAEDKLGEVETLVENELREKYDFFLDKMKKNVDKIIEVRDRNVPNAQLVMGEGVTWCASNRLQFEEKSELYWSMIYEQVKYLKEKGFWGGFVRTTSGPEDPSWNLCKDRYLKANRIFLDKE